MKKFLILITTVLILTGALVAGGQLNSLTGVTNNIGNLISASAAETETVATEVGVAASDATDASATGILATSGTTALDTTDLFTERDLEQTADVSEAETLQLVSGEDVTISKEGVYVLSGTASDVTVTVDAGDDAKVQLVLDGVSITNESAPAISIVTADKAFITLTDSTNRLEVTGDFEAASMDSVILSKSDLTINGTGSLEVVTAKGSGITSKDDLKITGGTYTVTAALNGLKANDSIRVCGGTFTINVGKDALHSENSKDSTLGYIYLNNATFAIAAGDDAVQGNAIVQIDGGTLNISTCSEGIESTYLQINGGVINIYATDDGMNASQKSSYDMLLEINGGTITIVMASGDTDALDSNGSMVINGGTLNITANSAFDYNVSGTLNGGTVTVNGSVVTELAPSQMGGGMGKMGGHGGKFAR